MLLCKGLLGRRAVNAILFRKRFIAAVVALLGTAVVTAPLYGWGRAGLSNTGLNAGFSGIDRGVALMLLVPIVALVWLVWFMYINLLAYVYLHRSGIPLGATDKLRALWPDVAGFQLFLQETEFVRLQHDRNPLDPSMAYCLALGLDPGFIRSLKS
jgi:hypothetical protein